MHAFARRNRLPIFYKDEKEPEYKQAIASANRLVSDIKDLKDKVTDVKRGVEQSKFETSVLIEKYKEVFDASTDDSDSENGENHSIASNKHQQHNHNHGHSLSEIPSTLVRKSQGVFKIKEGEKPMWRY